MDDNVGGHIVIIYCCTYAGACLGGMTEEKRIKVDVLLCDNYLQVISSSSRTR